MKQLYSRILKICLLAALIPGSSAMAQQSYLDTTFGTNGIVTTEKFEPRSIFVQQDGKILVAGGKQTGGNGWDCIIYRFNTDGSPDTGFGTNGIAHVVSSHNNSVTGIIQLPDGNIVALAKNTYQTNNYSTFIKLQQDGSLDTSYGNGGTMIIMQGVVPYKMVLSDDGKILVAGQHRRLTSTPPFTTWYTRPRIQRYNPDLTADASFSPPSYPWSMMAGATDVDIDADGNIFVVFQYGQTNNFTYKLAKFSSIGEPQTDFGANGIKDIETGSADNTINSLKIINDGKFLISGSKTENAQNAFLMQLEPEGNQDITFSSSGIFTLANSSGQDETAIESEVLINGKIVTALQKWNTDNHDFGLLFSNENGSPDTTSADNGLHLTPMPGNQILTCMVRQPDGKLLAAGFDESSMVLMRYDITAALNSDDFTQAPLQVYPNPATDRITITNLPDDTTIELYSISGQKLYETESKRETTLDLSSLRPGMYFINTPYGTSKIIKK